MTDGVAVAAAELDGFERLGERADLVDLDENRIGDALFNAALQALDVGDEEIVADELNAAAQLVGQQLPAFPVVFGETVFEGDDRILAAPVVPEVTISSLDSSRLSLFLKTYLLFSLS